MSGSMGQGEAFNALHELKAAGKDRKTSRGIIWLSAGIVVGFVLLGLVVSILDQAPARPNLRGRGPRASP